MNIVNKICTCLCCFECACSTACLIDYWHGCEASGLSCIECGNCCWSIFAPICHSCSIGDCGNAMGHCATGVKYCAYGCLLQCCAPIDGIYNCVFYSVDVCSNGVAGFGDILKNTRWIGNKLRSAFEFG